MPPPKQSAGILKPFIIPVFIPQAGCPHQCVFCDQIGITGKKRKIPTPGEVREIAKQYIEYKGRGRGTVRIAFYGGNFLGLPERKITELLCAAKQLREEGLVDGVGFSTRPDTVTGERLHFLRDFPVSTVEIGAQSMSDRILALSERGHTADDTKHAAMRLKERGYETGIQMMTGLPGCTEDDAMASAEKIAALFPDFVRIYPTVVIRNSPLEKWYRQGKFMPMPLDRSVTLVKRLYLFFSGRNIPVVRMGLQASEDLAKNKSLVAGPYHPAFGHLVHSEIFLDKAGAAIRSAGSKPEMVCISVHPSSESRLRGMKNGNLAILKKKLGLKSIKIVGDANLGQFELKIDAQD